jgi:hypothetical protein
METKPQNRFRLAPKESPTPTFPVAGAIANNLILAPVGGDTALEPMLEGAADYRPTLSVGELKSVRLRTSGYDDPQLEVSEFDDAVEPEAPAPPILTQAKALKFTPKAPPAAKLAAPCDALQPTPAALSTPRMVASTLRTKFILGPNPNKPAIKLKAPEPTVAVKSVTSTPIATKPVPTAPVPAKPVPSAPVNVKPAVGPAPPTVKMSPAPPAVAVKTPPPPPQKTAAAAAASAPSKAVEPQKPAAAAAAAPPSKPLEQTKSAELPKPAAQPAAEKPKINVRPTQPPPAPAKRPQAPAAPPRPAIAARDHGNALAVQQEEPATVPQSPKPKVQPIRPATTPVHDVPMIGMPATAEMGGFSGFWASASGITKGAILALVALVLIGGGYFMFRGGSSTPVIQASTDTPSAASPLPGTVISGGGWSPNWGSEAATNKGKQISIFRPTMSMADYTLVFNGQIEKKAIGWIFRAHDPKNYYVYKLKIVKPGVEPVVALEKFAVIDGKEDVHTQVMLNVKASLDTVWNIRTDVQGKKFTTYIQDKLADYMSDDRIKIGGGGFYNDPGEYAQIKNSAFYHITYKK